LPNSLKGTGKSQRRIFFLLPNCADPSLIPAHPDEIEPNTIGYAGSLIAYEGLDTLVEATARLRVRGMKVKVRIIGEGEARGKLENKVQELGLSEQVQFLGRVSLESSQELLRPCALVCIPRRPFEVCMLVPPIKLVEAMALGKPVVVPDLPVFRDELGDSGGGWFFTSGEADSLAETITTALSNPVGLAEAGKRARKHVLEHRNWSQFLDRLVHSSGQGSTA
jgi:glycosyltransferase involved in cell wall biosynthesis